MQISEKVLLAFRIDTMKMKILTRLCVQDGHPACCCKRS